MLKYYLILGISIAYLASTTLLASPVGISFSSLLIDKDPQNLQGFRTSLTYEPPTWAWQHFHVFFDLSVGRWWVEHADIYRSLNITSFAPVIRYYFLTDRSFFSPFMDISIGLSYLTKTRIDDRNLGMHFSFQDEIGIGTSLGMQKHFSIRLSMLHYSNGSMSAMNAGITIPLMLTVSYRL